MNGRVYDPLTAMFYSSDLFVQLPGNWVTYNRYGCCMNNPTRYINPSGYKLAQKNTIWYSEDYSRWMGCVGNRGTNERGIFDWYSANLVATIGGSAGGASEFIKQVEKQVDSNSNGTMTFHYSINHFVGKTHFENGNYTLPGLIPVGYSITIKIGRNSNNAGDKSGIL